MITCDGSRYKRETYARVAVRCSVLQCVAARCSVLQCTVVYCSVL